MIYKRCGRCGKRIQVESQCSCRYKEYNVQRKDKKEQSFYNSTQWITKRTNRVRNLLGIDWFEYYSTGNIVAGYTLHHIIELKDDWSKRLEDINLIYLTQSNHRRVHEAYLKSPKDKEKMQKILFLCLDKAQKEFGIIN